MIAGAIHVCALHGCAIHVHVRECELRPRWRSVAITAVS